MRMSWALASREKEKKVNPENQKIGGFNVITLHSSLEMQSKQ